MSAVCNYFKMKILDWICMLLLALGTPFIAIVYDSVD